MSVVMEIPPHIYCPYADEPEPYTQEHYVHSGRFCRLEKRLCFNWKNPAAIATCDVKKEHEEKT